MDFSYWFRKLPKANIPELISLCSSSLSEAEVKNKIKSIFLSLQNKDFKEELLECLNFSHYVVIIYDHLNKQTLKEMIQIE